MKDSPMSQTEQNKLDELNQKVLNSLIFSMSLLFVDCFIIFAFQNSLNIYINNQSIFISSIIYLFIWREIKKNQNRIQFTYLIFLNTLVLIFNTSGALYTIYNLIFEGKESFKKIYFEDEINFYFYLNITSIIVYLFLNFTFNYNTLISILRLSSSLIYQDKPMYLRAEDQSSISSQNIEVLDMTNNIK